MPPIPALGRLEQEHYKFEGIQSTYKYTYIHRHILCQCHGGFMKTKNKMHVLISMVLDIMAFNK